MSKKLLTILSAGAFIFSLAIPLFAQEANQPGVEEEVAVKKAVDVGNKICPVSQEKIDQKMKATYEYQGKIYNFCCQACIDEFKKDPEKYIKKVEEELKTSQNEKETAPSQSKDENMHGGMHEQHQH